jgi:hypothetical protein
VAAIIKRFSKTTRLEGLTLFRLYDVLKDSCMLLFGSRQPSFSTLKTKRQLSAFACLLLIASAHIAGLAPVFAQTKPAESTNTQSGNGDNQLSPDGKTTKDTVPNPYEDAVGNLYRVDQAVPTNQNNIDTGVEKILTGNYAPVVFQAAEQGQGGDVQKAANNILNASLGSVNDTYRGLHQWWKDDLVGNLFQNVGQLIGKWLSELIDGWIADAAQFLAKFLRVFVLNPNIAVNGLNGQQNDGISPYIRQGADIMYGIAVDLLLLLFILCIWKFWADASWGGAGNLMGPVGRLIFTAGLLLAWPTIYAFEIQISNEMIKAIYFNSADQVLMLDYALAQAVKGGVIAAGAGATSVFAPLLANLAIPVAGQFVGQLFYFASTLIFTVLGGILIAELVYILILKAIQTALLTAQYMFAPIFLVFFATPDTESYATGYVRAFVETSLWTFVWVGLLKIMTIILFSNFNPWGKILISIGVLQMMIQVPSFLGRAQISPVSDFVTAGLVFGTAQKALAGLGSGLTTAVGQGVGWFTDGRFADKGTDQAKNAGLPGEAAHGQNPQLLNSLNKVTPSELNKNNANLQQGPQLKTPGSDADAAAAALHAGGLTPHAGKPGDKPPELGIDPTGKNLNVPKPPDKPPAGGTLDPTTGKPLNPADNKPEGTTVPVPPSKTSGLKTGGVATAASLAALAGAAAAGLEAHNAQHGAGNPELPKGPPPDDGTKPQQDRFQWRKATAEGWDEKGLIDVDTRKLLGKLTSVAGVGLRVGQSKTSALGSAANGVQRVNIAEGAGGLEMAHAIYSAAFADNITNDAAAKDAARAAAVQAGGHQPHGMLENMAANWLSNTGSGWSKTALSKQNFQQSMFEQAVKGSHAFVNRKSGNAYTDYLRQRYGDWGDNNDAMAEFLITNPESSESPWNKQIGPATEALNRMGIPIGADTRGAMQNMAIQGLHPSRQKQAAFAVLSYCYPQAKELYGSEPPQVFGLALGEMAKALPADQVNQALSMYQVTGQDDLSSPMASQYMAATAQLAGQTQKDFSVAYPCQIAASRYAARRLGYISQTQDIGGIDSFQDLSAVIVPRAGESRSQAMQVIMESSGGALSTMEAHKVPMETVLNPTLAPEVFGALGRLAPQGLNSLAGSRALNIVSHNLNTVGAPHTAQTIEAMYSYENNGGSVGQLDQAHIILATKAYADRGMAGVKPHVIEVALNQGYAGAVEGAIPWTELEKTALHYQSGQVTDYRLAPVVGQLVSNNIPVSKQNIQLAVESIAGNQGNMDADQVRAVIRVTEAVKSSSSSPLVLETFARAQAQHEGINTSNLNMGEVLRQLENVPGKNYSAGRLAQQIVQISRQGGGFSDHQLQDPVTVNMLVDQGDKHPYAPQAINVVTRLVGSSEAMSRPQYVQVVEEFLDNDGKMRDMDMGSLNAAIALSEARASGMSGAQSANWRNVKITPQVLKIIQRDPNFSITDSNHRLSDELVSKIMQAGDFSYSRFT